MIQVGTMMNARLDRLEQRLLPVKRLRPPLAADKIMTLASQSVPVSKPDISPGVDAAVEAVSSTREEGNG